MASSVLGGRYFVDLKDQYIAAYDAIGEILKFYHLQQDRLPSDVKSIEEELEYLLRPHGIMHRRVKLSKGWYRDAYGPMLAKTKEGKIVALLPSKLPGYVYVDPGSERRERVSRFNEDLFDEEALCFYRPFPLERMSVPQLALYIFRTLETQDYLLLALGIGIVTLVGMLIPLLTHTIMGPVLQYKSMRLLLVITVVMVIAELSQGVFSVIEGLITRRLETKMDLGVEAAAMMRVLSLPTSFFREYSAGNLSERLDAISQLCNLLVESFLSSGLTSLASLIYITQIFAFAPALVTPAMLIIVTQAVFSMLTTALQSRVTQKRMETSAEESGMSYALISGIRKIRLAGAEKRAFARWADLYSRRIRYEYNPPLFLKMNSVFSQMITLFGTVILYFCAGKAGVSVQDYFAFEASYSVVSGAFLTVTGLALSVASIRPVLHMAAPLLETEPEQSEGRRVISSVSGAISLDNVSFRYNEQQPYVLKDLTLRIRAGEYLGIVGRTGCGKSTLMRLLLGFERPLKGAVYYDGRDVETIDLKSLHSKIGSVMQSSGVFAGSIYENVAISAPGLTLAEAWEACEVAQLADDIRRMPMEMHTIISEGGGGISGGQKQRLMIARAIASKPKILLFDEATSALDNRTQHLISEALDDLKCTRIAVAHRLSTIKNCDRIIVMGDGGILEEGTYEELMEMDGMFAELARRQTIE